MTRGKVYEVTLQICLDYESDEAAQGYLENKINEGEMLPVGRIFSMRPIPLEELGEDDDAWLKTSERYGTDGDGTLVDKAACEHTWVDYASATQKCVHCGAIKREGVLVNDPQCMVPECRRSVFWRGPHGMRLCEEHYAKLREPVLSTDAANLQDDVIRAGLGIPKDFYPGTYSTAAKAAEHLNEAHKAMQKRLKDTVDEVRTMYPIGKLQNYYGPGHEDLEALREAFRRYVAKRDVPCTQAGRLADIEKVIDDGVRGVIESRGAEEVEAEETNQQFVNVMLQAVKSNTEVQIHCDKHGEVTAFSPGNENFHCPECYNTALSKAEDAQVKQHLNKIPKLQPLPARSFEVGGAKSGSFELLQVRVAKPLAEYLRKCGHEALVYGCEVVKKEESDDAQ